jgi:tetratricopeptide (TPR) repeat protein
VYGYYREREKNNAPSLFLNINPQLSVGIGSYYRTYMGTPQALLDTVGVYISTAYRFPISGNMNIGPADSRPSDFKPSLLKVTAIETNGIFPVFYQYYDDHPIGKIEVKNGEKSSIDNLIVTVFINKYMDTPKEYAFQNPIKRGETELIDLYALFNENVLEITEGTKVAAEITLEYTVKGEKRVTNMTETLKLENRNASIWDDDRRAAAFVTARDPAVMRFSKNLISLIRETGSQSIDANLRTAIALHEALSIYGMTYVVDPNTPYEDFVLNKQAIDFLQFPRQTLEYKAGDCDDLSILYSSLLESVSIDTAFITVPGHIYIAFALKMSQDNARSFFANPYDLIYKDDKAWLPIEVTMVQKNFREAWTEGASEWRRYGNSEQAGFYPIKDAWKLFVPVGLPGDNQSISIIEGKRVVEVYHKELTHIVDREIGKALDYYNKANIEAPGNPTVLLGLARVSHALEDYTSAEANYNQLEIVAPEIAGKFAYLRTMEDTGARAASADDMEEMLWED